MRSNNYLTAKQQAIEILKCKQNPLYFLHNYVYIPETGGKVLYGEVLHPKLIRVVRSAIRFKRVIFMATRQLGKSTISAALILWAMQFYPGIRAVILNYRKEPALENIDKIKFMHANLPEWMKIPSPSSTFSRKTYFELKNGSKVNVLYPSTTHKPNTLARSLTVPILYIDEAAFIPYLHDIYGAAQQILSTARQQAIKHGYPYFQLVTSTPNGLYSPEGNDKPNWFYDRWENAIDSDLLYVPVFDDNGQVKVEELVSDDMLQQIFNENEHNGFVRVRYHWSEDPKKDEQWYEEQCRELSDKRLINQELDLLFVGATSCIFDDDTLSLLRSSKPIESIIMPYATKLNIYDNFDPKDYYLIGVDTASSLKGAFNAIEIFRFSDFKQTAELQCKLGSLTQFAEIVDKVFRYVFSQVGQRIILCIENNSIGKSIIEHLLFKVEDFDYSYFIYAEKQNEYGIKTTAQSKPIMVARLKEKVEENPSRFKSQQLISQFSTVERTNSGTIRVAGYSDLFMAACFCAYVRQKKELDILPQIEKTNDQLEKEFLDTIKTVSSVINPNEFIRYKEQKEREQLENEALLEAIISDPNSPNSSESSDKVELPVFF